MKKKKKKKKKEEEENKRKERKPTIFFTHNPFRSGEGIWGLGGGWGVEHLEAKNSAISTAAEHPFIVIIVTLCLFTIATASKCGIKPVRQKMYD